MFSPVKSDKLPACKTSPASVGAVANCRHNICDNDDVDEEYEDEEEDEDEDDDESVSDESSTTSNQKDGGSGKCCECWRCEFFGHADVCFLFSL